MSRERGKSPPWPGEPVMVNVFPLPVTPYVKSRPATIRREWAIFPPRLCNDPCCKCLKRVSVCPYKSSLIALGHVEWLVPWIGLYPIRLSRSKSVLSAVTSCFSVAGFVQCASHTKLVFVYLSVVLHSFICTINAITHKDCTTTVN